MAAEKKEKKDKKPNRLAKFLREVWGEVKKLSWPSKKELINYTLAVLAFIALMAVVIYACDFVFAEGIKLLGNI